MAEEECSFVPICNHSEPDSRASLEVNDENDGDNCTNPESNSYDSSDGNVLKCDQCCFETSSQSTLAKHSEACDGRRKHYECDVCMIKFSNGANMRRHKMRHSGFKPFQCRTCHKRFFRKDHLSEHLTTHVKPLPFHCPVCNRGFQRHIAMRAHFQNEHLMKCESVKSCPLCSYQASSTKSLQVHFSSSHGIDMDRPARQEPDGESSYESSVPPLHFLAPHVEISTEEPPTNQPNSNEEGSWRGEDKERCGVSSTPAVKQEATPSVDSSHSSPTKGYCLKSLLNEEPLWWRETSSGATPAARLGPLACPHCSITFPDPTLYFLHKGCHSDADPWRCNICGQQTQNVYDFNSHLLSKSHN